MNEVYKMITKNVQEKQNFHAAPKDADEALEIADAAVMLMSVMRQAKGLISSRYDGYGLDELGRARTEEELVKANDIVLGGWNNDPRYTLNVVRGILRGTKWESLVRPR